MQTRNHFIIPSRRRAGFTLVEILIVVSLVGLLAFVAVPNYIRARSNAAKSACINNLRQIDAAVQQWALEQGKSASSTVTFADISLYLKYDVVCPAGGTSFADSYSIATVASEPLCLRVPLSHLFPGSGLDLVTSSTGSGNTSGNPPVIDPPALPPHSVPGSTNNGSAARPTPPHTGLPHAPPDAGNNGQNGNNGANGAGGNGNGSGHGNADGPNGHASGQGQDGPGHNGKGTLDGSETRS